MNAEIATKSASRPHQTGPQWKKWNAERKARKRKWKEEKLMKEFEKVQAEKEDVGRTSANGMQQQAVDPGRQFTVSIAVPGSILDNAQSPELRVVSDKKPGVQMARILQYLECPQYLRKSFFPQHRDLEYAGLLNPLACPHHMSQSEDTEYREGVVLNKPVREGHGSFVNAGLVRDVQIDKELQPGLRVTVKMLPHQGKKQKGLVVAPSAPRTQSGIYWGYTTRLADNFSAVFTQSPFPGGYDLIVGTSERGTSIDEFTVPSFKHLLIVFGGLSGLEASVEADEHLQVSEASSLFHHYLNTCPQQGSSTIRTEEAILITLSALRPKLTSACQQPVISAAGS